MLEGQWTEIDEERVYYNYDRARNFINDKWEINPAFPIDISHDFNIGEGKPMSATVSQYIDNVFHFKKVYAIHGARTNDILDEMADDGLFEHQNKFRIFGDASGKARDTRSIKSDYDLIRQFVANYQRKNGSKLDFEMLVPLSNPPVRSRHNLVNSHFLDANGHIKLYVYSEAEMLDEGFRLTKLKKGGNYIEDLEYGFDTKPALAPDWLIHLLTFEPKQIDHHKPSSDLFLGGDAPSDRYNQQTSWNDLLIPDGWTLAKTDRHGEQHWVRPGKDPRDGTSATIGHNGNDALIVFTSSIPWLPEGGYNRFGYYAASKHGGDWKQASQAFLATNEGKPEPITPIPTPDEMLSMLVDWKTFWSLEHATEEWLAKPLIAKGRQTALFAGAKTGKSWLTLNVVAALASGKPILGQPAQPPIHCLYLDYEMIESDLY
jgi:hypothetical protein